MILLQSIDQHWREHLAALDYLRQGIHLRGYAQKNPKQEYKREAFELFSQLLDVVKMDVTRVLMSVRIQSEEEVARSRRGDRGAGRAHQQRHLHPSQRRRQRLAGAGAGHRQRGCCWRRSQRGPQPRPCRRRCRARPQARSPPAWPARASSPTPPRSAATTRVLAAAARSTSSATGSWRRSHGQRRPRRPRRRKVRNVRIDSGSGRPAARQLPRQDPERRAAHAPLPGDPLGRGAGQQGPCRRRHPARRSATRSGSRRCASPIARTAPAAPGARVPGGATRTMQLSGDRQAGRRGGAWRQRRELRRHRAAARAPGPGRVSRAGASPRQGDLRPAARGQDAAGAGRAAERPALASRRAGHRQDLRGAGRRRLARNRSR